MKSLACKLFALLLVLTPCISQAGPWNIDQLLNAVAKENTKPRKFVETKSSALLAEPVISRGTMFHPAADKLVKRIETPDPATWFIYGDEVILEKPGQPQKRFSLRRYPTLIPLTESVRSLLSGNLEKLEKYYQLSLQGREDHWSLNMRPRSALLKNIINEVVVSGDAGRVDSIETHESSGDSTRLELLK